MTYTVHTGDAVQVLRTLDPESVHCVVTSPPYWGLRDYGVDGQIGLEPTLAEFIAQLVSVFAEVRRVLRKDGTCWVNMGDSYACSTTSNRTQGPAITGGKYRGDRVPRRGMTDGFKHKDLLGQPWRLAFALQDAGWYLRSDIIWHKPNPMPESVTDRPTRAHEYVFMLSRSPRYHYDKEAGREPATFGNHHRNVTRPQPSAVPGKAPHLGLWKTRGVEAGRNRRTVWRIPTANYKGAHFATFPPKLVEPCILAGCPAGGIVLDPFAGSGTTGEVALQHGRRFVGIELNPTYANLARARCEAARRNGHQQRISGVA